MPDETVASYLHSRIVETVPSPSQDYIPLLKADGVTVKIAKVSTLRGTLSGGAIGSDSSADLTDKGSSDVVVTGTATITGFIVTEGEEVTVTFEDSLILTYDATNLPIPGMADIETRAGDKAILVGGPGNIGYIKQYIPQAVQTFDRVTYVDDVSGTVAPDADTTDIFSAKLHTSTTIGAPTGTPRDEQQMELHLYPNNTGPKNLTFDAIYFVVGCRLPTVLNGPLGTLGGRVRISIRYNLPETRWEVVDVVQDGTYQWVSDVAAVTDGSVPFTGLTLTPVAYAGLPGSPTFGMIAAVSDADSVAPGHTIGGGASGQVIAYYDGTDWRVMGGA